MGDRDLVGGRMARHMQLLQKVSAAASSVHTLDPPAVAVLNVFVTSGGALMTPLMPGTTPTTGKYTWNPKINSIAFYSTEGDSGAATIVYLAEAGGVV